MPKKIDIFIAHAWRTHSDWVAVVNNINNIKDLTWRNFSVPWHDPALHMSTEMGKRLIKELYVSQIISTDLVIVLIDLYKVKSNHFWLDLAVNTAKKENKPCYGIKIDNYRSNDDNGNFTTGFNQNESPLDLSRLEEVIQRHAKEADFYYT